MEKLLLFISLTLSLSVFGKGFLKESSKAFDKGNYQEALKLISNLDITNDLDNSDDMKLAFRIRAISYAETGNKERALETIRELYILDSNYHFDLFDTPQLVVELAEQERKIFLEKNQKLLLLDTKKEHKDPMLTNFLPLGLNHYYLDSPLKGTVYLSVQTLGFLTNIAAFWWKQSYLSSFGSNHLKDLDHKASFNNAQIVQFVGLGTVLVGFVVSVIDAFMQYGKNQVGQN
jgi:tetratricopeptide (TPR) repeat protein